MNIFQPYVMPIFRQFGNERSFAGTAFCIDGYLVTAGHVIQNPTTYYVRNGNDYHPLEFDKWIPQQLPATDRMGYDIALYPIDGLKSPLSLAQTEASSNDSLNVLCWQLRPAKLEQVATQGLVINDSDEPDHMRIATVDHITHGCSGCPAFDDDGKVYGMITMGRTSVNAPALSPLQLKLEQNSCWAFKSSYMLRFMPK